MYFACICLHQWLATNGKPSEFYDTFRFTKWLIFVLMVRANAKHVLMTLGSFWVTKWVCNCNIHRWIIEHGLERPNITPRDFSALYKTAAVDCTYWTYIHIYIYISVITVCTKPQQYTYVSMKRYTYIWFSSSYRNGILYNIRTYSYLSKCT